MAFLTSSDAPPSSPRFSARSTNCALVSRSTRTVISASFFSAIAVRNKKASNAGRVRRAGQAGSRQECLVAFRRLRAALVYRLSTDRQLQVLSGTGVLQECGRSETTQPQMTAQRPMPWLPPSVFRSVFEGLEVSCNHYRNAVIYCQVNLSAFRRLKLFRIAA